MSNAEPIKLAFGLGASVETLSLRLRFRPIEDGVWLPARVQFAAEGRALLAAGFKVRTLVFFSRFRRFEAETRGDHHPAPAALTRAPDHSRGRMTFRVNDPFWSRQSVA